MEAITLQVGKSITLRFKSLATAGYLWDCESDKTGIVSVVAEGTTGSETLAAGQSLDEIFDVAGLAKGNVHLTFKQRRSWEKEAPLTIKEYAIAVE